MAISALLPWLRVGRLSLTATEVDGEFLLIGGGLIALAGLARWSSAFTGVLVMTVAAGGLVSAYDVFSSDYSGLAEATDSFVAPAYGLIVGAVASFIALILGLDVFVKRNSSTDASPE